MKYTLQPDALFASYAEVTPAYLKANGIKLLFTDVDNTLAPYEIPEPDDAIRILDEAGLREQTLRRLTGRIAFIMGQKAGEEMETGAILFSKEYGFLCETENAQTLLQHIKEE